MALETVQTQYGSIEYSYWENSRTQRRDLGITFMGDISENRNSNQMTECDETAIRQQNKNIRDYPEESWSCQFYTRRVKTLTDNSRITDEKSEDYQKILKEKINEIFIKIQNGETEPSYQIGSQSFTEKEWDAFLEKFDSIQAAIKELMKEEQEQKEIEQIKKNQVEKALSQEESNMLAAESTKCTYPTENPNDEDIQYITWYTTDGIFCRKAGQTEGYEWSIPFENKEQYDKAMNFISQFPSDWNLQFAAHENFWTDFLNDEIDMDGFKKFMEKTNKGVPDYSITIGDSVYIDKEKMQWAKYLNPLGGKFYTREELLQKQEEILAANAEKLCKFTDPYEDIYKISHPNYNGEKIFCEYPGGALYTANEIAKLMYDRYLKTNN